MVWSGAPASASASARTSCTSCCTTWRLAQEAAERILNPSGRHVEHLKQPEQGAMDWGDVLALSGAQIARLACNVGARAAQLGLRLARQSGLTEALNPTALRLAAASAMQDLGSGLDKARAAAQDAVSAARRAAEERRRAEKLEQYDALHRKHHTSMMMIPAAKQMQAFRAFFHEHRKCSLLYPPPTASKRMGSTLHEHQLLTIFWD